MLTNEQHIIKTIQIYSLRWIFLQIKKQQNVGNKPQIKKHTTYTPISLNFYSSWCLMLNNVKSIRFTWTSNISLIPCDGMCLCVLTALNILMYLKAYTYVTWEFHVYGLNWNYKWTCGSNIQVLVSLNSHITVNSHTINVFGPTNPNLYRYS